MRDRLQFDQLKRREFIALLGGAAVAWPSFVCAQPKNKLWRIGFLSPRAASQINLIDAFRQGMRDLGYVEGRIFLIEARYADGQYDRLPTLARELLELGVDIILAAASPAIRAAQVATKTVPIVMAGSGDPVANVSRCQPGATRRQYDWLIADLRPTSARSTSNS